MSRLSQDDRDQLARLLADCLTLRDPYAQHEIILRLPRDVGNKLPSGASLQVLLAALTRLCAEYPGGLVALGDAVRYFEGETIPMRALDTFLAAHAQSTGGAEQLGGCLTSHASSTADNASHLDAALPAHEPSPAGKEPDYAAFLPAYAEWLRNRFRYLPMPSPGGVEFRLTLDEVYVPLAFAPHTRRGPLDGTGAWEPDRAARDTLDTVDLRAVFTLAGSGRHLFVRGDPGSGKTTALKKMLWSLLDQRSATGFDGRGLGLTADTVPAFLRVRGLAGPMRARDLGEVLDRALADAPGHATADAVPLGFGRWLWARGEVLLLLDGLDEIGPRKEREAMCRYVEALAEAGRDRGVRVVASSRRAGIEGAVDLDPHLFLALDVRPLDDDQITELVTRWFSAAGRAASRMIHEHESRGEERALGEARDLLVKLRRQGSARIKSMLSTPLLLTLLCLSVQAKGQHFPERRVEFFRACLDTLLGRWPSGRVERHLLSLDESLALLQPVAWRLQTHDDGWEDGISEPALRQCMREHVRALVSARDQGEGLHFQEVLDWFLVHTGVLRELYAGHYTFLHLSLQEYLAALHVGHTGDIEQLAAWMDNPRWREVLLSFVATPGHRHQVGRLLARLIASDRFERESHFLRECLLEAYEPDLTPLVNLIRDRGETAARRLTAMELVRHHIDDAVVQAAVEAALEPPPAEATERPEWITLQRMAEQVEAMAPPITEADPLDDDANDVLLVCTRADEAAARLLAAHLRGWDWRVEIAVGLDAEPAPHRRARSFVVVGGADGRGPWDEAEARRHLLDLARRGRPMVLARIGTDEELVPPLFLQSRKQATQADARRSFRLRMLVRDMLPEKELPFATHGSEPLPVSINRPGDCESMTLHATVIRDAPTLSQRVLGLVRKITGRNHRVDPYHALLQAGRPTTLMEPPGVDDTPEARVFAEPPDVDRMLGARVFVEPVTAMRFLWVPGGAFWMGSEKKDKEAYDDETPRHRVQVSPFWLAETPVTNEQYQRFLQTRPNTREPRYWRERRFSHATQPIVGVSWSEATAFCDWLAAISGRRVVLPSEAQWEFAARSEDGRRYPWGNDPPDHGRAHYGGAPGRDAPLPVGSLPSGRGPYGHLDLAGNVDEWCRDVWDPNAYRKPPSSTTIVVDPCLEPSGERYQTTSERSARGGGFECGVRSMRAARRFGCSADVLLDFLGFRVAIVPTRAPSR
ncbi:SUMF1/EgtB/PvdO family nonheme iron enzyme [Haliangium sp.]|uniref:SUMF1/EgtB/PvdO family nonheme iron enzyme n=1 Tax=Haliangium sp. TaxID=2663208 RepID=UPI003D09EEAD